MRNDSDLVSVIKVAIIFYILSVIGGIVLQYWDCKNAQDKSFIDKLKDSAEATWYIPLMFTIFIVINFIIQQPFLIEIKPITLLLTFFIRIPFLFALVMYIIAFQNYCALAAISC
jgi:ACR3 family arsenite efflux pump ArsB